MSRTGLHQGKIHRGTELGSNSLLTGIVFLIHLFLSVTGNYKITGEEMNALPCSYLSSNLDFI